jgi:hypothetical protein
MVCCHSDQWYDYCNWKCFQDTDRQQGIYYVVDK